jgi:hypothetical protein
MISVSPSLINSFHLFSLEESGVKTGRKWKRMAGGMVEEVKYMPPKHKALSSNLQY